MEFLTWVLENQAHVTFGLIVVVAALGYFLDRHIRGDKILHKELQEAVEGLHKCLDEFQKEVREEFKEMRKEGSERGKELHRRLDKHNSRIGKLEGIVEHMEHLEH